MRSLIRLIMLIYILYYWLSVNGFILYRDITREIPIEVQRYNSRNNITMKLDKSIFSRNFSKILPLTHAASSIK